MPHRNENGKACDCGHTGQPRLRRVCPTRNPTPLGCHVCLTHAMQMPDSRASLVLFAWWKSSEEYQYNLSNRVASHPGLSRRSPA